MGVRILRHVGRDRQFLTRPSHGLCVGVGVWYSVNSWDDCGSGAGVWLGAIETPVGIAGLNGLLKLNVIEDVVKSTVPLLLPINVQGDLTFVIDLADNTCTLTEDKYAKDDGSFRQTTMAVLPSKHRCVPVTQFDKRGWAYKGQDGAGRRLSKIC